MLEEDRARVRVHPIDIGAGDQFKPEFLAISPTTKIPAMVDQQGPDGKPFRARGVGRDALLPRVQDRKVPAAGPAASAGRCCSG